MGKTGMTLMGGACLSGGEARREARQAGADAGPSGGIGPSARGRKERGRGRGIGLGRKGKRDGEKEKERERERWVRLLFFHLGATKATPLKRISSTRFGRIGEQPR
jgi:hypothetical protein